MLWAGWPATITILVSGLHINWYAVWETEGMSKSAAIWILFSGSGDQRASKTFC